MTKSEATEGDNSPGNMRDGLSTFICLADEAANNKSKSTAISESPPLPPTGMTDAVTLTAGETNINLADNAVLQTKVYRRRWLILALSCFSLSLMGLPYSQFVVLSNVLTKYYGVGDSMLEWTSLIFSAISMVFIVPCNWFTNKYGLRKSVLITCLGTALGQWVKVLGCWPDRFWLIFLGQTLVAVSFNFGLVIPPKMAAVWFPANELSTALAAALICESIGAAVGTAIAPFTAREEWTKEENMAGLLRVHISMASVATVILVAVFFLYKKKPSLPPSAAQAAAQAANPSFSIPAFASSIRRIVSQKAFLILVFGFTILAAVNVAVRTLMVRALAEHFPDNVSDAAWLTTILTISGPFGVLGVGLILDRTKLFKEMAITIYSIFFLSVIGYALTIAFGTITLMYCVVTVMGISLSAMYVPALELAIELNYPEPEGNPANLVYWVCQPAEILVTQLASFIFSSHGANAGNGFLCGLLGIGYLANMFVPKQYRRRDAELAAQALKREQEQRHHSPGT